MAKFLSMVSPDDVETQILDWGQFQWLNEPRVTGAQKQILGLGRIKPGKGHTRHNHEDSEEFIQPLMWEMEILYSYVVI